jgi:hypothetical protein
MLFPKLASQASSKSHEERLNAWPWSPNVLGSIVPKTYIVICCSENPDEHQLGAPILCRY